MNDLNETLTDITRSLSPKSNKPLQKAIEKSINFRKYIEPPDFDELHFHVQNELLSAWLMEFGSNASDEVFSEMLDNPVWREPDVIAGIIKSRGNWEICLLDDPWSKLIAGLRCAAERAGRDIIQALVDEAFNSEARRYGQYDPGTSEFIGWRTDYEDA